MKTRMPRPIAWLAGLLAVALLGLAAMVALALQATPLVPPVAALAPADVAHAKQFLRLNDPRRSPPGTQRQLRMSEAELELLLNQLSRHYLSPRPPALRLRLLGGRAELDASLALAPSLWLNLRLGLREDGRRLAIDSLRLGRLPLPSSLGRMAYEAGLNRLAERDELRLAREMVQRLGLRPGQLELVYEWRSDSYQRMLASLLGAEDQARLRAQTELLASWTRQQQGVAPLTRLLPAAFALAHERSSTVGADAAAENRIALLSLALYALGRSPADLAAGAGDWPQARLMPLSLHGRPDFPMHFLVSAALAAVGGGPLADAIGIYKEQADARDGSGFSFNDIAADRAGTRFGLLAMQTPERLQQRLAAGVAELDLLPDVSDLPEYLSQAEFRRRYGAVDAPAYRQMMATIEARLDGLALLR